MISINDSERVVIKIGSALVADIQTGEPYGEWMESLADDVAELRAKGKEVILVSSGAVALGRKMLGLKTGTLRLEEKQAAAACGQIKLVRQWEKAFARHNIAVAQLLLTMDVSEQRRRYLNARNTLETLLENGVIPIVNENDTVATSQIRVGDNDRLSARVAQMASADVLVLLSDVDGLYTADPTRYDHAEHVPEVEEIDDAIHDMAGTARTDVGTGGMATKVEAAEMAQQAGCHTVIACGLERHPLRELLDGGTHTWFIAEDSVHNLRKQWIAGTLQPLGEVVIDAGAEKALNNGNSLLPVGVVSITGAFDRGDAVLIKNMAGDTLAKGLIAYNDANARQIIGCQTTDIEGILGYKGRDALVHRDDMVML